MPRNKKVYDDDDGRTIADMSDISRPPMIVPDFSNVKKEKPLNVPEEQPEDKPWEEAPISKQERRAYVISSIVTALGIGAVFVIAGGLFIFLITRLH